MQKSKGVKSSGTRVTTVIAILLCVILIPVLVMNLTIIVKSFADPDEVPGFAGYKPLIVLSGSMEPVIFPGDIVVVRETPAEKLQEGDIVAFLREKTLITHRIIKIDDTDKQLKYYTKGDNNNADDNFAVTENMLEGKYVFRIPRLGHAAIFIQKPAGIILFVAVPLILFILYDIFRRRHYDKRELAATKKLEEELETMRMKLAEAESKEKSSEENLSFEEKDNERS